MQIRSQYVDTALKPYQTHIKWRDTMNYAAATGDDNPLYFDDGRPDGIIAPPMFSVAVTWPMVENLSQYLEIKDFPHEIMNFQVHYSEHLLFHRPIRPDDTLTVMGRIAAILPHRAGTHFVLRLEAVDQEKKAVFTEHIGAMLRGVKCLDDGAGAEMLPRVPAAGDSLEPAWESSIKVAPLLPFIYDGCTNIVFPIHTSKKFARQVGLPGIILQGTATLALAARELINREAQGNSPQLEELYCRFTGMVIPGSTMKIIAYRGGSADPEGSIHFDVLNAEGKKAIRSGYAGFGR